MSQVKVSVIVPFYGVEPYIGRCAESLLRQTAWQDCEFIFVDDGCKDGSLSVLQGVLARYPERRVQVIRKENGGLPQARLTGLKAASGIYVLHVDSDDWLEENMVEELLKAIEGAQADVAYCYAYHEYEDGHRKKKKVRAYADCQAYADAFMRFHAGAYVWNKLIRRSLFRQELFFPTIGMHEDMVLLAQVFLYAHTCVRVPLPLYHYRRDRRSSISNVQKAERDAASARNFLQLIAYWRGRKSPIDRFLPYLYAYCGWKAICFSPSIFGEFPFLREEVMQVPGSAMPSLKYRYRLFKVKRWLKKH